MSKFFMVKPITKFVFKEEEQEIKPQSEMIKVDAQRDVRDVNFEKSELEKKIADIESQLKKESEETSEQVGMFDDDVIEVAEDNNSEEVNIHEKLPPRPQRRKVPKREVIKGVVIFAKWSAIVTGWRDRLAITTEMAFAEEADRIDIVTSGWRICISAAIGEEFNITLYFDYKALHNTKALEIRYVNVDELIKSLDFIYKGTELFIN